jgi:hypothetical protein
MSGVTTSNNNTSEVTHYECHYLTENISYNNLIIKYIRNNKNQKIGVLLARYDEEKEEVCLGWALCCKKDLNLNNYDRYFGLNLALDRTYLNDRYTSYTKTYDWLFNYKTIPSSIHKDLKQFIKRIKVYYKDKKFSKFITEYEKYFDFKEKLYYR